MEKISILDVCNLNDKSVKEFKGTREYVATRGIEKGKIVSSTTVNYKEKPSRANREVEVGDILVAKMKDTDKVLFINEENKDYIYSTGLFTIKPDTTMVNAEYIYYILKSKYFQEEKNKLSKGATQKALNNTGLKKIKIPFPSKKEQEKIVNVLKNIESIITNRQYQISALSVLKKSFFLDMFGEPNTNPKGYPKKSLKDIGKIITGNTPPRKDKDNYGDSIEWIKTNNIKNNNIHLTQALEFLSKKGMSIGRIVPENSILVTCIAGSKSSIGRAAIANREVAFNQQINAIIPFENTDTTFLYSQIKILQPYIQSFSTNSMKGMISKSKFEKIEVILPTLEEQLKFSDKFNQVNLIEEKLKDSLKYIEELHDSLLYRIFNDIF